MNDEVKEWEKARVIHNPERLAVFEKEAQFMGNHCIDYRTVKAYRQLRFACKQLRQALLGIPQQNPVCRVCEKRIALCNDGTFRTHSNGNKVCKGSGMSMCDQAIAANQAALKGKDEA